MTSKTPARPTSTTLPLTQSVSYLLAALLCLGVLVYGLLPGLLGVCLGYLFARALAGQERQGRLRLSPTWAAALVIVLPLLTLGILLANARGMAFGAVGQYQALLHHLATTLIEIRKKLPPDWAGYVPEELISVQELLADYLKSQARALAGFGTKGLHGLLLVYVGLAVGALLAANPGAPTSAGLRLALRARGRTFIAAFGQVMLAQLWIAAFNAFATAALLLLVLPLFGVAMPYVGSLVVLTFFCGLVPIVGNLVCNTMLTLAGLSVSPAVGLWCLVFLVVIHKAEYAINARILGRQTNTAAWELLVVMFVGEAVFGLPGLVAAPLYYAFAKRELQVAGWV